ncbi:MAG: heparinase II/III family protein [Kiloniellaceae bacterium]
MADGSHAERNAKAGMTSGDKSLRNDRPRRQPGRRVPLAGELERLRAWRALPGDLAWGRLAYALKRPLFALPAFSRLWRGTPPAGVILTPPDPWPGNAQRGADILDDCFHFLGHSLTKPAPRWDPVGVEPAWLQALHGFSWLRDLRAVGGDNARRKARALLADWIEANSAWAPVAWHPVVTANRLSHWFSQYEFFAASADVAFRQAMLASAARQAGHLAAVLPAGLSGGALVAGAKGLCMAGLCLPGGSDWLSRGMTLMAETLEAQILSDGSQRERSPGRLLSILRDCIDLRAALLAAGKEVPSDLNLRIEGLAAMLRLLLHGDGGLALFNGSNEGEDLQIGLVLQRAASGKGALHSAPAGGFQRLQAGRSLVLVDSGRPPPPGYDALAHAGTLSFEMSVGRERLIVNCGAQSGAGSGAGDWRKAQRSTAAHSTAVIADTNSSQLFAGGGFGRRRAGVTCRRDEDDGSIWLEASHDGYQELFGLTHHRRLYLSANGEDLRGEDSFARVRAVAPRQSKALDFALRFHLHPEVRAMAAQDGRSVFLRLPKGGGWRLRCAGAELALEQSIYLGQPGQVRRSQQIVLSGAIGDTTTTVKWALQRMESAR